MASLRQATRDVIDIAREGIGWIILYRQGKSWCSTYCYPEYDDNTGRLDFSEEEDLDIEGITTIDPEAIIVNSYYCNLGSVEDMTINSLADALLWQYEECGNKLRYCELGI